MSYTFTKLFSSITASTVWMEPSGTRLVWITMLANCDRKGRVFASMPGLAHLSRVSLDEAEVAIRTFLAPDPHSRTPDNEGRRVREIDGGWELLNYAKYRSIRDEETIREAKAEHMRRKRSESGSDSSTSSTVDRDGSKQKQKQKQKQEKQEPPVVPLKGDAPPRGVSRETSVRLKTWLDSLDGEMAVPADDPIFTYARNAGLEKRFVRLAWYAFRAEFVEKPKRMLDWRATFRNYVRKNYLRLWTSAAGGGYELTAVGVQQMRAMEAENAA